MCPYAGEAYTRERLCFYSSAKHVTFFLVGWFDSYTGDLVLDLMVCVELATLFELADKKEFCIKMATDSFEQQSSDF